MVAEWREGVMVGGGDWGLTGGGGGWAGVMEG
jgi:hypothetical protein